MAITPLHNLSDNSWEKIKSVTYEEKNRIIDLSKYLRNTPYNDIIVRTTYVAGGWHDNEFNANYNGFKIYRFINPDETAKHNFDEYYHLIRRS